MGSRVREASCVGDEQTAEHGVLARRQDERTRDDAQSLTEEAVGDVHVGSVQQPSSRMIVGSSMHERAIVLSGDR